MNEARKLRLTGTALILLGAIATTIAVVVPLHGENGLVAAPVAVLVGLVMLWTQRPTARGQARRDAARRSGR